MDRRLELIVERQVNIVKNKAENHKALLTDGEYMEMIKESVSEEEMTAEEMERVVRAVFGRTRSRVGRLSELISDERISEVMVNGPDNIFIELQGVLRRSGLKLRSREELEEIIRGIAASCHREINEMTPILDARLEDGSRVNAVYSNVASEGPVLTVRKFSRRRITLSDMVEGGTLTREAADIMGLLVRTGYNILISGGTSSGKTTFLNALTDSIPKDERVIVIEDSRELMLDNIDNIVQMECHQANSQGAGEVTMEMLIRTSLRMRPDRIIVGEVRGGEVAMMLQAMNTGHDGSITTGHGNSVQGMLRRLEALYMMAEDIPLDAIQSQILEGIDIVVHLARMKDGKRRVVEISELAGIAAGDYLINPLFKRDSDKGLRPTGNRLANRQKLMLRGRECYMEDTVG